MADMLTKSLATKPFDLNADANDTDKVDETTFLQLTTVDEYWSFVGTLFLDTMYEDVVVSDDASTNATSSQNMFLQTDNMLLGPPRLRQIRVRNGSCAVHEMFRLQIRDCYGRFRLADEELGPFGVGTGTAWQHADADRLSGVFHWGQLGTYPGGGYYQDLATDRNRSAALLDGLRLAGWLDRASRVVMLEFAVYNANMNLFCVAK